MAWLSPLLSERERMQLDEAKAEAQATLAIELESTLPSPELAALLLSRMSRALPN